MTETKQVLVVRTDLKMGKGKIAAQCAHASLMVFSQKAVVQAGVFQCLVSTTFNFNRTAMEEWFANSFAKVCVQVDSEAELEAIYYKALDLGIPASLVVDQGRTEFNGVATKTVVAIGPDYNEKIDELTGGLKLL